MSLKTKLQTLLYYGIDDADGEADDDEVIIAGDNIAPRSRFGVMSTLLWQVMQKQLYQPDAARRLISLTQGVESSEGPTEAETDLFSHSSAAATLWGLDDFVDDPDEEEEDMMDYDHCDDDFDSGILLEVDSSNMSETEGEENENLFQEHETMDEVDEDDILLQDLDG